MVVIIACIKALKISKPIITHNENILKPGNNNTIKSAIKECSSNQLII